MSLASKSPKQIVIRKTIKFDAVIQLIMSFLCGYTNKNTVLKVALINYLSHSR